MIPLVDALWWVFASLAVLGGLGVILARNPVGSLLSLVLTLFSLGVIYLLHGAHFIAVVQLIVYAGAIMVLFLFVIMLLNLGHDYQADLRGTAWLIPAGVAGGIVAWLLAGTFRDDRTLISSGPGMLPDAAVEEFGAVGAIAMPLLREYVVAFELTSLLLLAAIIGAVLLGKRRV